MEGMAQARGTWEPNHQESCAVHTFTLEELIKAVSEEVEPGEDQLVAEVVLHLLDTGRIKPMALTGESASSIVFALCDGP